MTTIQQLNDYLKEVVYNSEVCARCTFNHSGICFFASKCVENNFILFKEIE